AGDRVAVRERLGYLALTDDAGREGVVPVDDPGGTREQFSAGPRPLTGRRVVALPQIEHRVGGETQTRRAGDQSRHLGERERLGAAFREGAAEGGVGPPGPGGCAGWP